MQGLDAARLLSGDDSQVRPKKNSRFPPLSGTGLASTCRAASPTLAWPSRKQALMVQGGAKGPQSELMETYIKEQSKDDTERDPEMCAVSPLLMAFMSPQ